MRTYISGKITGTDDYVERFAKAETELMEKGHTVINPVKVLSSLPKETVWGEYMAVCLALLALADTVYLMRGWEQSRGACIEYKVACDLGKTIMRG